MVNRIDLKLIAKAWVKFLKFRLMPTTHTITVSQDQLILLYVNLYMFIILILMIINFK